MALRLACHQAEDGRMERSHSITATAPDPRRSTTLGREPVDPAHRVSIRPIERVDAEGLSDFYADLSERSRRQRFLGATRPPTTEQIAGLVCAPGVVAVLADRGPRDGAIVGHASIHPDGSGGGEAAFAVADELQGHGLGAQLMAAILEHAHALGIHRLNADLYADNVPMRRLLVHSGRALASDDIDTGIEEITLDLDRAA
jgi:acetyltransferase